MSLGAQCASLVQNCLFGSERDLLLFVLPYFVFFFLVFCDNVAVEERVGCFVFVMFWMSCHCYRSLTLSHSAVG